MEVHTYVLNNHIKYQNYFERLSEGLKKDAIRINYSPTFARIDTAYMRINFVYIGVNGDDSRLRGRRTHFLYVDKGITNEELITLAIKPMLFGQDKREERLHWI
jgi:hypothetical protein